MGNSNEVGTNSKLLCDGVTSATGRQCLHWIETEPQGDPGGSKCEKQDSKSRVEQV